MFRLTTFIIVYILSSSVRSQQLSISDLGLTPPQVSNCTSVKDQYLSATCWSFASTAFLESEMLRLGKPGIDLSEMYVARYSWLRKIRLHLLWKGENYLTPGGQFHDLIWVMKNHGMMPESAYPGRKDTLFKHDHGELDTLLTHFVKKMVNDGITKMDRSQENYVDSILDEYIGAVPDKFQYEGNIYTAFSFVDRVMELDPDDYVEITSYTHHPFYSKFMLEDKYNWNREEYYNVSLEDFSLITDEALKNNYTVGWDGDADDPQFNFYQGIAFLPTGKNDQSERQQNFETKTTLLDHMMQVVANTTDRFGRKWYYIKNSWGSINPLGGFMYMREDYFRMRTVAIIVNKNAIPLEIRTKLQLL